VEFSSPPEVGADAATPAPAGGAESESPRARRRPASRSARAELATVQTLAGAAVGVELCAIAGCDSARAWAGATLLGASAGLGASMFTTRDGIPQGRAQAVNTGTLFGAWTGLALFVTFPDSAQTGKGAAAAALGGQLLGAGAGLALDHVFALTEGEVSLAGSAALWTGVGSLLAAAALNPDNVDDHTLRRFYGTTLALTGLALAGGGYLARMDGVSRGRALLVDAGAIAGGGLLPLLGWLARGDSVRGEALLWSGLAGVLGGAATMYLLTRHWDVPDGPPLTMSLSPTRGGAVAGLQLMY